MSASVPCCEHPVFIIGSPRSGTSVLAWSLAQHPDLWTSQESDLLYNLFGAGRLDQAFAASESRPDGTWLKEEGIGKSEFLRHLGSGFNEMFSSRSHPCRWVDQTPVNTLIADSLAGMFPGAFFLHILRDGRRVVNSMINFTQAVRPEVRSDFIAAGYLPAWAVDFREACRTWSMFAEEAHAFCARHPERGITVVNEDIVRDPHAAFRRMFDFLGAAQNPASAEYFGSNRINSSFGAGQPAPRAGELSQPWLKWTDEQKQIFSEEAGAMMIAAGFAKEGEFGPRDVTAARIPARSAAPAATGETVRIRQVPLDGPVRQLSAPEGLWHDSWIGPRFEFRIKAMAAVGKVRIVGKIAHAFADGLRLDLNVNHHATTGNFSDAGDFDWSVPCDLAAGATAQVTLNASSFFRPKDAGNSSDGRELSFVLRQIFFEPAHGQSC